jgi:hypothetical protein
VVHIEQNVFEATKTMRANEWDHASHLQIFQQAGAAVDVDCMIQSFAFEK